MQQKLSICCALLPEPKVIVFDEPMVGLDPHAIKELKAVFAELKTAGASVLIRPICWTAWRTTGT